MRTTTVESPAMMAIMGLGALALFSVDVVGVLGTSGWSKTTGHLTEAHARTRGMGMRTTSTASVTYTYTVHGETYTGHRLHPGVWSGMTSGSGINGWLAVQSDLRGLHAGDSVPVWYDPEEPSEGVLYPSLSPSTWITLLFGFAALGLSVFVHRGSGT